MSEISEVDDIIGQSDLLFRRAAIFASNGNKDGLLEVHNSAIKLIGRFDDISWPSVSNFEYENLLRMYQSWISYAYRYNFDPPDITFPPGNSGDSPRFPDRKKLKRGMAVRDSLEKTAKVELVSTTMHKKYGKTIKSTKRYLVHDEFNQVSEGDVVLFKETRPISKKKNHSLVAFSPSLLKARQHE